MHRRKTTRVYGAAVKEIMRMAARGPISRLSLSLVSGEPARSLLNNLARAGRLRVVGHSRNPVHWRNLTLYEV